jgi:hypothetical protein
LPDRLILSEYFRLFNRLFGRLPTNPRQSAPRRAQMAPDSRQALTNGGHDDILVNVRTMRERRSAGRNRNGSLRAGFQACALCQNLNEKEWS